MNPAEYANIEKLESKHWYYVGKRLLVRYWIEARLDPKPGDTLLDCGAGTGRFAEEMAARWHVMVLDDHEESLQRLRSKFPPECVLRVSATGIPLGADSVDAVTALDVLEHIQDDAAAVREMKRVLKTDGVVVATVPASMALWSDWDESLHHFRRYDRSRLAALFPRTEWDLLHLNYSNVLVYPVVWLLRKWRRIRRGDIGSPHPKKRAEDRIPPHALNSFLRWTFVALGKSRIPFPFGVSLILVARKR